MPLHPLRALAARAASVLVALSATVALAALAPAPAVAQTPTTMVIEVPEWTEDDDNTNLDFFGERFAIFADGTRCTEGDVPQDGGAFSAVLGEPGQPEACSTAGALVVLAGEKVGPLVQEFTFAPGTTTTLENWAPLPTHTAYPDYVCAWMDSVGAEATGCQVVGPPVDSAGPAPSSAGSMGPQRPAHNRDFEVTAVLMLVLTIAGAAAARMVARR